MFGDLVEALRVIVGRRVLVLTVVATITLLNRNNDCQSS